MDNSERKLYGKAIGLILPIAFQNLLAALVSVSDALMLGRLNQNALSAVSLAAQVQFVLNLFYSALTVGMTILSAQYWGKKDTLSMEKLMGLGIRLSILVATLFFGAAQLFPNFLMRIFTFEERLVQIGSRYLQIVSWSYLLMAVPQVYLCSMKNSGRVKQSTLYGAIAVIANIVLNAIFIFGLFGTKKMGTNGAALATDFAIGIELLLVLWENYRTDNIRIRWEFLCKRNVSLEKAFFRYSFPVFVGLQMWGLGFTMFSAILQHLGTDAVAASSIATTAKNIISCFFLGLGSGTGIMIGNELGKNNLGTARAYGSKLLRFSVWTGIFSGALILLLSPVFLKMASLSSASQEYLKWMLLICGFYIVGKSINVTLMDGIFCAGGDTKFGVCCDFVTMWLVIGPLGFLPAFTLGFPVPVVYFILSMDECIKLPAVYRHYKKYKWLKNLT